MLALQPELRLVLQPAQARQQPLQQRPRTGRQPRVQRAQRQLHHQPQQPVQLRPKRRASPAATPRQHLLRKQGQHLQQVRDPKPDPRKQLVGRTVPRVHPELQDPVQRPLLGRPAPAELPRRHARQRAAAPSASPRSDRAPATGSGTPRASRGAAPPGPRSPAPWAPARRPQTTGPPCTAGPRQPATTPPGRAPSAPRRSPATQDPTEG